MYRKPYCLLLYCDISGTNISFNDKCFKYKMHSN